MPESVQIKLDHSGGQMIKLAIFDLDGVLVDAKDIHYMALNRALASVGPQYVISRNDHLTEFDGLPTMDKLKKLTATRGLPEEAYDIIWQSKQNFTREIIKNELREDVRIAHVLKQLKDMGMQVCVASNSIRETIKLMLLKKGYMEHIDFFLSNQDVRNAKPNPEIYLKAMITAGVGPHETLIMEDSHVGLTGALASGGHVCPIKDASDLTFEKIESFLNKEKVGKKTKWKDYNLNVLIPMAGRGSRFEKAGYTFPKPLIDVAGKPMIQLVVENLNIDANYIFVVQKEHYERYALQHLLNLIAPNCKIVIVDGVTEGAACTTLLAKEYIDNDMPLIMANSDQYIEWDSKKTIYSMKNSKVDGAILTFTATHPKWSFAKVSDNGMVTEVAEKVPISDCATTGIYYWSKGSDYVKYAEQMINKNIRVNNEFYVCPVFNEAIQDGRAIKAISIEKMWGIGTPEDLNTFLQAGVL